MIKYHGTPITPKSVFKKAVSDKNVLISFAHPGDLNRALELCNKICLDNGAFSFWTKNKKVDWNKYYEWVEENYEAIEFFIIPDVIDGTQEENDQLIREYCQWERVRMNRKSNWKGKGIPVWHLGDSLNTLRRMKREFSYIAFGSSAEYATLGTHKWHKRMNEAMKIVCDEDGVPNTRIHMLRCLDAKIFTQYPFYSGDSTNLARNHSRDGWHNILKRIEPYSSPKGYKFKTFLEQGSLF